MHITLITPTPPDVSAFGVRMLSAYMREKGHTTTVIFLAGSIGLLKEGGDFTYHYPDHVMQQVVDLCRGAGVVGVSFMTNYFDRAIQLTQAVKQALPQIPVIWGGVHPSCKPAEGLDFADLVCVGEGEETLLDLVTRLEAGGDLTNIPGTWSRRDGQNVENPLRALIHDLDALPLFDFSNEGHYFYNMAQDAITPLTDELFKAALPMLPYFGSTLKRAFRTMTDRGCPHRCTYCNISNIKAMYDDQRTPFFRRRGVENVIHELEGVIRRFPFVEAFQFFDDTFFARPYQELLEFSAAYKEKIGLPFYVQASPTTLSEKKLIPLLDAGLIYVEMGVQTGSARIKEMYRRKESNERIVEGTELLHRFRDRMLPPDYHVIIDNPWETPDDTLDTVKLLYQIPKPYGLCISSLVFYPQTELYERALREGLIQDETAEIYRKPFFIPPKKSYPNFLIYLLTFQHFPRNVLGWLMRPGVVDFFFRHNMTVLYAVSYRVGEMIRLGVKGYKAVMQGDWQRIALYVRRQWVGDPVVAGRKQ